MGIRTRRIRICSRRLRGTYAQQLRLARGFDQGLDVACPLAPTNIYYSDVFDKTIKQTAVFGEVTYDLTDRWSVTGGARWFEYDRNVVGDLATSRKGLPVQSDFEGGGRNASKGKESDTVFKVGTEFHFDAGRMVYLLYSEGFRLGGTNSARAAEAGVFPLEYEPDKLNNYEAGLKSQWFDDMAAAQRFAVLHGVGRHPAQQRPAAAPTIHAGCAARSTAARPSRKASEMSGGWQVTA